MGTCLTHPLAQFCSDGWGPIPMDPALQLLLEDINLKHLAELFRKKQVTLRRLESSLPSDDELREIGLQPEERGQLRRALSTPAPDSYKQACFEFAICFVTFVNLADGTFDLRECSQHFPQYIVVGDQSAGKTSVLSRLAKMSLGFVSSQTGTRRPFQFELLFDESALEPEAEVDGEPTPMSELFDKLSRKNHIDGFAADAVSVRIRWRRLMNLCITDMPGLKDKEEGPEKLLLERLRNASTTPIVVLEPRDMEQKHAVYELLEKATPKRNRDQIIVLQNKCDQLISGNWQNAAEWKGHFEGSQAAGFKAVFFTGRPPSRKKETEVEQLQRGWARENAMLNEWGNKVRHTPHQQQKMGIKRFAECLAKDQMDRAETFALRNGPDVKELLDEVARRRMEADKRQRELQKRLTSLVRDMSGWVKRALRGEIDSHRVGHDFVLSLGEDLDWLFEHADGALRKTLREGALREIRALRASLSVRESAPREGDATLSQVEWESVQSDRDSAQNQVTTLQHCITSSMKPKGGDGRLFGGAAVERSSPLLTVWCCLQTWSDLMNSLTPQWVQNVLGEGVVKDSGNKVIRQFLRRTMEQIVHPLIDVVFALVCEQMERVVGALLEHPERDFQWSKAFVELASPMNGSLQEDIRASAHDFIKNTVSAVKQALLDHVDASEDSLQLNVAIGNNGRLAKTLATNTAGVSSLQGWFGGKRAIATENWRKSHMKQLVDKHKPSDNAANPMSECIQLAYGSSVERAAGPLSDSGSIVETVSTGLGLDFKRLWEDAADLTHIRITALSDDFHAYVQQAKRRVEEGLEAHLLEAIVMRKQQKYAAAWEMHYRQEVDRLRRMECALQGAEKVYRSKIFRGPADMA